MNIAEVFNSAAKDYDATRKKYIACFDDFYCVAMDLKISIAGISTIDMLFIPESN